MDENEELYMSEGEDGRPTIKWRRKQTMDTTGEGEETEDTRERMQTEEDEMAKTEGSVDTETELLI